MSIKKIAMGSAAAALVIGSAAHASVIDRPFFKVLGTVVVWSGDASGNAVVNDFIIDTSATPTGADTDLIAGDGIAVITGTLNPVDALNGTDGTTDVGSADPGNDGVLDASALSGFNLGSDVGDLIGTKESSFYVASNTAFNIEAVAANAQSSGTFTTELGGDADGIYNNIQLALSVGVDDSGDATSFGGNAQLPGTDFNGFDTAGTKTLADLTTKDDVFLGSQRTAASRGSITEQSVRFDAVYSLVSEPATAGAAGESYDLSMGTGTIGAEVTYTVYVP